MDFILWLLIFIVSFVSLNWVMSNFGILSIFAKEFKTQSQLTKTIRSTVNELRFVRVKEYGLKEPEYRAWLFVFSLQDGLYIKQRRVLNLFPKEMLIPWSCIRFAKVENKLFGFRYFYEIQADNQLFYLISSRKLEDCKELK